MGHRLESKRTLPGYVATKPAPLPPLPQWLLRLALRLAGLGGWGGREADRGRSALHKLIAGIFREHIGRRAGDRQRGRTEQVAELPTPPARPARLAGWR